jgi:hypothetical protein
MNFRNARAVVNKPGEVGAGVAVEPAASVLGAADGWSAITPPR